MQLTLKYHGELVEYFPDENEDNETTVDINDEDTIYTVMERFNIPVEKIYLVLVNGVKVKDDDCASYRFTDGDTLAVWPANV